MKKILLVIILGMSYFQITFSQDNEGCKDHPLLTRMPGYFISECSQKYDQLDFWKNADETIQLQGNLTYNWYVFNPESGKHEPSFFQIIKNYSNAIIKIGGTKIFEDNISGFYELKRNGKEYKIKISCTNNSDYMLYVLEMEPMVQDITANAILDALNKDGYIALNILFETNKSTIQAESQGIIDQIFKMLSDNPDFKVSIEGHTDNVGDAASNKKLSEARAKAVNDALISKGIDKSRLAYKGWGQEKPVADNRSEDGRAKNRRVEIVKM